MTWRRPLSAIALVIILTLVTGCTRKGPLSPGRPGPSGPESTSSSPDNGSAPSTQPTPVEPPPSTASPVAVGTVVTGQGTLLAPPIRPTTRTLDGTGCQALADPGWSAQCDVFTSAAGRAVWLVEYQDQTGLGNESVPKRALLYKPSGPNEWSLALRASDDDGRAWESVAAQTSDVAKDGNAKAVFSIRPRTGNTTLAVEVVEASGDVVLHLQQDRVVARLHPDDGIEYWFRDAAGWNHRLIRYRDRAWRIVVSERGEPLSLPPTSPGRL